MARTEGAPVVFDVDWPTIKTQIDTRNLDFRFEEDTTAYEIFAVDENFLYTTVIYKSGQAPQNQSTYDTWRAEFEASYKNKVVDFNNTQPYFLSTIDGYSVVLKDGATPTANDGYGIAVIGYDGANYRMLKSDTSGRPVFVGAGTAGSSIGGVVSVQGVAGGVAISASQIPNIDAGNSSTTTLGSNATFTGTGIDVSSYGVITVFVFADKSGTLNIQFSTDNSNWDYVSSYVIAASQAESLQVGPQARYFRVVYVNDNQAQSVFRLQTVQRSVTAFGQTLQVSEALDANANALVTKSVITGKTTGGGGGYVEVKVNPSGTLTVDASGSSVTVSGTVAATQSGTWTVQPGNTANTTPWLTTINQGGNSATVTGSNALKIDGSAVTQPVSGTVTANIGTTNGLALDTTLAKLTIAQGTALGSNTQALVGASVTTSAPSYTTGQISPLSLTTSGLLRTDGSGVTQPVSGTITANQGGTWTVQQGTTGSGAGSPWSVELSDGTSFYTGAKTGQFPSALVGGRLDTNIGSWLGSTAPTVGSKTSANSVPVVIASDQVAIPVSQSGTWTVNLGTTQSDRTNLSQSLALSSTGNNVALATPGTGSAAVQITGSWTGTLIFEATVDGSNWFTINVIVPTTSSIVTTTTANGQWLVGTAGYAQIRVRCSVTGTGTATISLEASAGDQVVSLLNSLPTGSNVIGAVTQSGTWTVQPGNTANTTPWLMTINQGGNSAAVTGSNALKIDGSAVTQPVSGTVTANAGTGNFNDASIGSTGSAVPSSASYAGFSDGTNLQGTRVFDVDTGVGTQYVMGVNLRLSSSGGSVEFGTNTNPIRIDPTGTTTQPVSGTVTANIGTTNGLALDATLAKLTIAQGTSLGSNTQALVGGSVTTAAPSYTTGQISPLSLTTGGLLRVDGSGVTQPVSGTITANQGTSPWVSNITQFGSNNVVTGTGASGVGIPRVTVSNDSNILATQSGSWTVTSNQGTAAALSGAWPVKITDGTNTMPTGDAVGRAIFHKITDGTNTAAVKAASTAPAATDPALVIALSPNNSLFAFGGDSRLRVGQETLLFFDNIDGTTVDTNKWTQSQSGMTQSQTGGNLTLNAASSTTSGNYSILTSAKQMLILDEFPLYVQFRAKLVAQTNAVIELGFGNAATTATPTDGVFVRIDSSGNLKGVINFNGSETLTANLATISNSNFYNFEITIFEDHATFEVQASDSSINTTVSLAIPLANGSPSSIGHLPVYTRVYNSSATSSAAQIVIASVNAQQLDLNMHKPWSEQMAGAGRSILLDPSSLAQSANYTNNTAPSSATLSNTAAGYTTLGGLWQFAAVTGAETDYALFAYQVPTGFQLYIWSVTISAFITGAQSSTNSTLLQWGLAANSSAVSLATGAPNPPIRTSIGMQQAPKTANIGDTFAPGIITYSPKTPIVVNSGKYLHIILRIPIANATASQIIRGSCTVEGYFE